MKYLKIVNSFDEFAEDARAGTVYYHNLEDVYYWLNLKTIWGYIGYNVTTRSFNANGKIWNTIPSVPDPEHLTAPITTLTSSAFTVVPNTVTFNYSDFGFVPLTQFNGLSGPVRTKIDCQNSYPLNTTTFKFVNGVHGNRPTLELVNADLSQLYRIDTWSNSYNGYFLVLNDSNGYIDLSKIIVYHSYDTMSSTSYMNLRLERPVVELSEDSVFVGIEDSLNRGYYWNNLWRLRLPDTVTKHIVKLHEYNGSTVPVYRIGKAPAGLTELVIDGENTNGVMQDAAWDYIQPVNDSGTHYYTSITYRNITNYGSYLYRYFSSEKFMPVTQDMLNYLAAHNTDIIKLYANSEVTLMSSSSLSAAWVDFWDGEDLDLTGVKSFIYYPDTGRSPYNSDAPTRYAPIYDSVYDEYQAIQENGASGTTLATPKMSNVNLDHFAIGKFSGGYPITYIRTDDTDVYLGTLYMSRPADQITACFRLGNYDLHISGTNSQYYSNESAIFVSVQNNTCTGHICLDNFSSTALIRLRATNRGNYTRTNDPYFDLSNVTGKANPTPEDYLATNIDMEHICPMSGAQDTVMGLGVYSNIRVYNSSSLSTVSDSRIFYTSTEDWAAIKCYYPYYPTYINKYRLGTSTSSTTLTATELTYLIDAVPNVAAHSNGLHFGFSSAQYALLTSSQINYLTGLGYTVIEII